jgi:hypothetical protein
LDLLGEGDRWHPRYLKQISSLLYALAGVESQKGYAAPEAERLNHALIPRSSAEGEAAARDYDPGGPGTMNYGG